MSGRLEQVVWRKGVVLCLLVLGGAAYLSSAMAYSSSTLPDLSDPSVTPALGGWGEQFTFSVRASEFENETFSVCLLVGSIGRWRPYCNSSVQGINVSVSFSLAFQSADRGMWSFLFNATDADGSVATGIMHFTVDADDLSLSHRAGNGSVVLRPLLNATELRVAVADTDLGGALPPGFQGRFWSRTPAGQTGVIASPTTTSAGELTTFFDPDCSFSVGPLTWTAGLVDNATYKDANSSDFALTIESTLQPGISLPYRQGFVAGQQDLLFRGRVADDCGTVEQAEAAFFAQQGSQSFSCPAIDEGNGSYSCRMPANATSAWPAGLYNVSMVASKSYYAAGTALSESAFRLCPSLARNGTHWTARSRCLY
ncbi:MAG: hypothetical protein HY520_00950 [Candidatus Aenigmarchaeota archaeon]|nr:hypothetical protein [Candidatus Aenigmarchaeota archaeon]